MCAAWERWPRIVRTVCVLLLAPVCLAFASPGVGLAERPIGDGTSAARAADRYAILAWNDLGMHCYNPSFQDLAVLPPFNTLWAQVVRVGDPPQDHHAGNHRVLLLPR